MSRLHRLYRNRLAWPATALALLIGACEDVRTVTPAQRSRDAARNITVRDALGAASVDAEFADAEASGPDAGAVADRPDGGRADAETSGPDDGAVADRPDGGRADAVALDVGLAADAKFPELRPLDAGVVDGATPDARPFSDARPAATDARAPTPDASAPPADALPVPDGPRHHPPGYDAPAVHGVDLRLGTDDCQRCHGERLAGDSAPGCDTCHAPGWRTNCVYCHGGVETRTGAPPRDLNGEVDPARIRFGAHTVHTSGARFPFYGCDECHRRPADVLSAGHVFDDTPGRAEIDFSGGLSLVGAYPGNGQCNSLYCHGNGAITGNVALDAPPMDCQSCHPTARLLGFHVRHVVQGALGCHECHARTTDAPDHILDPALHLNGRVDVEIATPTLVEAGRQCTGMCHGEDHPRRVW